MELKFTVGKVKYKMCLECDIVNLNMLSKELKLGIHFKYISNKGKFIH